MVKRFKVKLPIIRKNYFKTRSFRFKGNLFIVSNEHGVIYDWKIKFTSIEIDLFTTKSWFKNKNTNFKRREQLFKLLNLKQEIRMGRSDNKLLELDSNQITIVNNFLNNRNVYSSTIKNIIPILKGNNPGGEAKNPKSAEMVLDLDGEIKNFVILLDDLIMKNKDRIDYDTVNIAANEIDFKDFIKLNGSLSSAFDYMQKNKDLKSWSNYLVSIKEYYKKYNLDIALAENIAKKARSRFSTNIDKEISSFPFGFKDKNQFQKCHIYEFHDLRDHIVEAIRNNKNYSNFEDMIADPNNFLPLPNEIHRKFDANYFTYKLDGTIWPIHEQGKLFIDVYVDKKFYKIQDFFLNDNRKKYLEMRNKGIIY